jgi:ribosome-binding factor A
LTSRQAHAITQRLEGYYPVTSHRQQRVSEMLREELTILVGGELSDPFLADAMANVVDVEVSPDLRNARVIVEHALPSTADRQVVAALRHAESFLRAALAASIELRYIPELTFKVDATNKRGDRIDSILDEIAAQSSSKEGDGTSNAH